MLCKRKVRSAKPGDELTITYVLVSFGHDLVAQWEASL
jgi:hypothetical protein